MIGTIVNTATILTGSIIGSLLKKGIKEKYNELDKDDKFINVNIAGPGFINLTLSNE